MPEPPQTIQQRRAAFALEAVKDAAKSFGKDEKESGKYKSYAAKLPFMIHANGLGQAAAFFRSKQGDKTDEMHGLLYQTLSDWLTRKGQPFAGCNDLLEGITQKDMGTYIAAQAEAMAFMDWVKKFAKAFIAGDPSND